MFAVTDHDATELRHDHRSGFRPTRAFRGVILLIVVGIWGALLAGGIGILWRYEHTPGLLLESPQRWPSETTLIPSASRPTLVLFAHPKCPCTRASIAEFERLMTRCQDNVKAYVAFVKPSYYCGDAEWEKTDLWTSAERIPGVTVVVDEGGREADRFRATTSGYTLLYDTTGRLRFSGGVTSSRGHEGDNLGRSAIRQFVDSGVAEVDRTKVYGCALVGSQKMQERSCCQK
ncbi:hypothetical protein [Rhodopirellula sp. SWK7]|uniref:hypothetical protein n=1 Tax=Rhodopirellula sp. SWK7 TaxID=595460 RepID=UPI0002BD7556|nr:hypothetical protein [Rhodopirellula sp. SWK7]EMI44209.1 RedB [Rhodopirellula sp. SWK7]